MRTLSFLLLVAGVAVAAILAEVGLATDTVLPTPAGVALTSLSVGGVRIVWVDMKGARPFNYPQGYSLSLVGESTQKVFKFEGGRTNKAVTDTGESLLPYGHDDVHFTQLSEDGKTLVFEAQLALPSEKAKAIKELSGKLVCTVVGKSRIVDLGIKEFKEGEKGTEFAATITSLGKSKNNWSKEKTLVLTVGAKKPTEYGSVKLYDENGKVLDASIVTSGHGGNSASFEFAWKDGYPTKGRIELEVYEDVKAVEIPFKMENIPLIAKPTKPKV